MSIELEYATDIVLKKTDFVLEEIIPEVLEIRKDAINILGTEFLIRIDEEGNFTKIKNILLDEPTSFKLTQLLWNLAFVHITVHRSRGQFGHAALGDKLKGILGKILNKLTVCSCLYDILLLIHFLEAEGSHINSLL